MLTESIKWNDKGLVPAIVQEITTKKVLMLAYMNRESLQKTLETGFAHYYSRSRQKLWMKGENSGNVQSVSEISFDCDSDAILLSVYQKGLACHNGTETCFDNNSIKLTNDFRDITFEKKLSSSIVLNKLFDIIQSRKSKPVEESYTCELLKKGSDVILKKIGEEASEVIIAAKNNSSKETVYEIADLLYHVMVLLVEMNIDLKDVWNELESRM